MTDEAAQIEASRSQEELCDTHGPVSIKPQVRSTLTGEAVPKLNTFHKNWTTCANCYWPGFNGYN